MQSSTAIALRALVMLVFLISIPMFAIFGKDVPQVLKGLVEGRGLVLGPAPGDSGSPKVVAPLPSASNPFGEPAPYRAGQDAMSAGGPNRTASNSAPNSFSGSNASSASPGLPSNSLGNATLAQAGPYSGAPNTPASPNLLASPANATAGAVANADWRVPPNAASAQPAGFQIPANNAQPAAAMPAEFKLHDPMPAASNAPLQSLNQQPAPETAVPASYNGDPFGSGGRIAGAAKPDVATAVRTEEKFRSAETRLRELGAAYYKLETWGADNAQYRFACEMSIGGNGMNRYFEARDNDPWRAMDSVLRQVEEWRSAPPQ